MSEKDEVDRDYTDGAYYECEDCGYCRKEAEQSGIEYKRQVRWDRDQRYGVMAWICEQCGRLI